MIKIVITKGTSTSWENKTGFIVPLFKNEIGEYTTIKPDDFPNNGNIFVTTGFEKFEDDYFYEINSEKIQDNTKNYEQDLKAFLEGASTKNPSSKIISGHSTDIKKLSPDELIPIYENKFSLSTNKLVNTEGIESNIFFLKESISKNLFGPYERDGNELKAANFKNYENDYEDDSAFLNFTDIYSEYDGTIIFEISFEHASNFIINDNDNNEFLVGFKNFISNKIGKPIDFTPIPLLHKWAIEKLSKNSPKIASTLNEIKNLKSLENNNLIDKLKWNKYISILDQIESDEKIIDEIVKILFNKKFISETINTAGIEKLEKELENLKNELVSKDKANLALIDGNSILKDEKKQLIEELKEEKKNIYKEINASKYLNLAEALNFEEKIAEIENILKEKITSSKLKNENNILEGEKRVLERDIKKREEDVRGIEDSVKKIKDTFDRTASEHTAKLQEAKIYTDLLNGIEISPKNIQNNIIEKKQANVVALNSEINSTKSYILEIQKRLLNQGREISYNDVGNLIITINQTFLTIIAGAPGVGKTSLVEKLSKSYGLNNDFGYLEIACAKGWTSSKDLIGFFNPLTQKYQSAKTNLKEALEKSESNPRAPYIVLLDEANLSPIEHYWSDFIKLADTNYSRKIKISDNNEIQFGDGFRFVATINHDHTTEALSNRLIDRAAIIHLDKPIGSLELNDISLNADNIFDFKEVQNLFKETQKWKTDEILCSKQFRHFINHRQKPNVSAKS